MVFALSAAMIIGIIKGLIAMHKARLGLSESTPTCTNLIEYFADTKYS
jgi:hypothetical protein